MLVMVGVDMIMVDMEVAEEINHMEEVVHILDIKF